MNAAAIRRLPAAIEGERVRLEANGDGGYRIIRRRDGSEAGEAKLAFEGDTLFVEKLEIAPELRSYGLGTESAHLLRDAAEAAGFALFRSWAARDLGLSVYFWIRMGLHPLHGEGPNGGIWMERRLQEMPELSRFFGIIIRMYVEAGPHHAKHFHAYYQERSAVIGIEPITTLSGVLPVRQQRFVEAWAEIHLQELLDNWTRLQSGGTRQAIPPLE